MSTSHSLASPPNFNLFPYSSSHPNTLDALPFIAMAVVTLIYSLVQVRFELETLPFQAPKCQDYRWRLPHLACLLCICACIHICVHMCIQVQCMYLCTCVEAKDQCWESASVSLHLDFQDRVTQQTWSSPIQLLGWPENTRTQLFPPSQAHTAVTDTYHGTGLFAWMLGIWTWILMLAWKANY